MTWPATPMTSNRHAHTETWRPCMATVTICCALGSMVSGDPGHVGLGLLAGGVEVLAEVSAAMHQRDGDHGRGGVRRRAQGVAGQHAQATGVGGKRRRQRDLHGEVCDAAMEIEAGRRVRKPGAAGKLMRG